MRTDLTIRLDDASEQDVAVDAPAGTSFGAVIGALSRVVPVVPAWCGGRRLEPELLVGRDPLTDGAVLSADRRGVASWACGARLEVVGGARCGQAIPMRRGEIDIGRDETCSLTLDDPQVSRRHVLVTVTSTGVRLRDLGSTHGTYLDGVRVNSSCALGADIPVRLGDTTLILRTGTSEEHDDHEPEPAVIEFPAAPPATGSPRIQWLAALVPAIAGIVLAALMHSMQFLAFAALSPLALLLGAFGDRLHARRTARRSASSHRDELAKTESELATALRCETERRRRAHVDAGTLLRSPTGRWRRARPLHARLGLADLPSATALREAGRTKPAATLHSVPYVLDLTESAVAIVAVAHLRYGIARWLIVQLAALVSPAELEFALFTRHSERWHWMRWLPQLRGRVACAEHEHRRLIDEIAELSAARHATVSGRWLVLIMDEPSALRGADRLGDILAAGVAALGVTALCLDEHVAGAPVAGMQIVRGIHENRGIVRVGAREVLADRIDASTAEEIARRLAPTPAERGDTTLPDLAELPGLLGDEPIRAQTIRSRWRQREPTARTVIGVGTQGAVSIDLDRDGPHTLIAGTTGSGKSELLQTLVVGLAAQYPPDEITFLLVDYKGGAALSECAALPHTVGVVTDLDERLTRRVLVSLDSEIRRREALLADARAPDRRAYCESERRLPRLVLVVDEFATLADELPKLVPGLVSIAQRGRSLGVHLVLATQRPAGAVSPEIRANTALRIALRTTSAAESIDVIDTADAASIGRHTPGRAYVRTGTSTVEVQCARVTGPAPPKGVRATALDEWRRMPLEQAAHPDTALSRYLAAIRDAAEEYPAAARPWLPPLPWPIRLDALAPGDGTYAIADLPATQVQRPLSVDLATGEALLVSGSARSGRSHALLALATAVARAHPPDEVHVHAIDCSAAGLADLEVLPHLGTRLVPREEITLVARFLVLLEQEVAQRKSGAAQAPAIVLLVDGWEEFVARADEYDNGRTTERLLALLHAGPSVGLTLAVTGGRATLTPRVASAFGTRFLLRMNDPGDYAQAGIAPDTFPDPAPPGRGVRVGDGAEVQFALARPRATRQWPPPTTSPLQVRPLPHHVSLRELPGVGSTALGVGGDSAVPITVELRSSVTRMLVAGPARSGRSTLLRTILAQERDGPTVVAAPPRSPLVDAARERHARLITPSDPADDLDPDALLLVDDFEAFADTVAGAALLDWLAAAGHRAVVAGRSDSIALDYRGIAAEVRRSGCGVLLRPGGLDGELLGVRLPPGRADGPPGRGVLVPDPAWQLGTDPLTLQVAQP